MLIIGILEGIERVVHNTQLSIIVSHTYSDKIKTLEYLKILHEKRIDGIRLTSENFSQEYYEY